MSVTRSRNSNSRYTDLSDDTKGKLVTPFTSLLVLARYSKSVQIAPPTSLLCMKVSTESIDFIVGEDGGPMILDEG